MHISNLMSFFMSMHQLKYIYNLPHLGVGVSIVDLFEYRYQCSRIEQNSEKVSKTRITLTALFDLVFVQLSWLIYVKLPTDQDKAKLEMAKVIFWHIFGNSAFFKFIRLILYLKPKLFCKSFNH